MAAGTSTRGADRARAAGAGPSRRLPDPPRRRRGPDTLLNRSDENVGADAWTVGRWPRYWLTTRTSIRPSTLRSYTEHVELHLIPHLGRIRLGELTGRQVADMFHTLGSTNNRYGRPPTPATLHRIRATLRSALNAAIRDGLLRDNPARHIELPSPRRPHAEVWTDHRVKAWQERGERFPVAVWTVRQLVAFFAFTAGDRLFALWWLIALRGLRRGEAAGLRWADVDLDGRVIVIGQQRIAYGHMVAVGPPKTASSRRVIALDRVTARLLRTHLRRQRAERNAAGESWQDSGYVFTTPDGTPLHPDFLTRRFGRLVTDSGLPPVRLHDLRHGAPCRSCSGTPASCSPPTPTRPSCSTCTSRPPRPPPVSCWPPRRATRPSGTATGPGRARKSPQQPSPRPGRNPSVRSDPAASEAVRKGDPRTSHGRPTKIKAA